MKFAIIAAAYVFAMLSGLAFVLYEQHQENTALVEQHRTMPFGVKP